MTENELLERFPELRTYPGKGVCIPVDGRVAITPRVQAIIDTPLIQRLRSVRQLAFAHMVYPGATHTRFEHTLGVYNKACRYVKALIAEENGRFLQMCSERDVSALLVAALLHDAAHYPLAHAVEELVTSSVTDSVTDHLALERDEAVKRHEHLLVQAIDGKLPGLIDSDLKRRLTTVLELWDNITLEEVAAIIGNDRARVINLRKPTEDDEAVVGRDQEVVNLVQKTVNPDLIPVLHSILDGPLDVDKLDYLQRDSLHTGNPAGFGVDEIRLIDSLTLGNPEYGLAIRERGLSAAHGLFQARFAMFLTVYWHQANRALVRMFTEAIDVLREQNAERFNTLFASEVFHLDDEALLEVVGNALPSELATRLVVPLQAKHARRENVYQRVLTIRAKSDSPNPAAVLGVPDELHSRICYIFERSLQGKRKGWKDFDAQVRSDMLSLVGGGEQTEILIDVPDPRYELPIREGGSSSRSGLRNRFMVHSDDGLPPESVEERAPLFGDLLENWRKNARKVRVFASPRVASLMSNGDPRLMDIVRSAAQKYREI